MKTAPLYVGRATRPLHSGYEEFTYELRMDLDLLRGLAQIAAGNKNGRTVRGPFTVQVTERKKL